MMKKQLLIASTALLSITAAQAGGEGWTHDFEAAKEQAAKEGKSLLVDFTGSDWCKWCIKLNEEVFQHDPFKTGVADKFVLVELDYPRDKSKLSEETIAQNQMLKEKYQVQGYPTILVTDAQGRPYAKTGYRQGGPEAYVTHLNELLGKKVERDAAFEKAGEKTGVAKAEALFEALQIVPEDYRGLYPEIIAMIKKNDPDDATGLGAAQEEREAMMTLEKGLQTAMRSGESEKALTLVDEFVAKYKPTGEEKQKLLAIKLNIHYRNKSYGDMEKVVDEIIEIDPDSKYGKQLAGFKKGQLQELKKKAQENE